MASYPGTKREFLTHVNTTEVVDATHMNDVQDEINAVQGAIGINPMLSTAGAGSTLGAWSGASRSYATLIDRLANIEAGIVADAHPQYSKLSGIETYTGTKTFAATDTFFGAATGTTSGNVYFSSGTTGGQATATFREGAVNRWQHIFQQGLTAFRLRDLTNARDHVTYTPGVSSTAATTAYASSVTVAGNTTLSGTLGVTGASTLAALTLSGALTLAAGTGDLPAASNPGDAAAGGTSTSVARATHVHAREAWGTALSVVDAAAASAGTATTTTRSDHKHAATVGATTAETTFGLASTSGVSTALARADHAHGTPATPVTTLAASGNLSASAATGAVTVAMTATPTFTSATIPTLTGATNATGALSSSTTVTGTTGVFDGASRVYSSNNPPPIAAPVVIMPFYVGGAVGVGLRRPEFIATVPMTIRGARSRVFAGSGTYQVYVNGAAVSGTAGAFGTTQALYDFVGYNINAGDRVQLNVNTASTDAVDLSVTVDTVTR